MRASFYVTREPMTVYGGKVDKKNPQGLVYLQPGEQFDGRLVTDSHRADLIARGVIYYWPLEFND